MDDRERLHTAARRYCIENHAFWCDQYSVLARDGRERRGVFGGYTDEAIGIFPRYNVLNAILEAIEGLRPHEFVELEHLRQRLVETGYSAQDPFTLPPNSPGAEEVMKEERAKFVGFIGACSAADLARVAPLPYRRSLTEAESASIRKRMLERWSIGSGYWHPIEAEELPEVVLSEVIAFQARHFEAEVGARELQSILSNRGLTRVWELRELRPDLEIELSLLDLLYTQERYWTSDAMDWVVYVSHESSITIAGRWLVDEIQNRWPIWRERVYAGWDYE